MGLFSQFDTLFQLTPPVDGDFSWVNQGSASVVVANGWNYLSGPSNASAHNNRIRIKSAPATPYTITAGFLISPVLLDFFFAGLVWRQSSDGKLVVLRFQANSLAGGIGTEKWTNASTFSAVYAGGGNTEKALPMCAPMLWARIADDGTNRITSLSADGANFITLHTIGRTDFLTADQVGFYVNPYSQAGGITLLSWKQG